MEIAGALDGEILSCDSMQVYRGLDIGTGKATPQDRALRRHHLLDLVDPGEPFSAASWAARARVALAEVTGRGRLPVIVGGTGLYFRALTAGLFEAPPADPAIRARHQVEAAAIGVPALYARLAGIDPTAAAGILPNDLLRTSRALEVFEQTGVPISELRRRAEPPPPLRLFTIVLEPALDDLRAAIGRRVDAMMAAGFLDEVRALRARGFASTRALAGLGYLPLSRHLDGAVSLAAAVEETRRTTAAYARRQRTWFRRETAALRATSVHAVAALAEIIAQWRAGG